MRIARALILFALLLIAISFMSVIQSVTYLAPILAAIGIPAAYLAGRIRHNRECSGSPVTDALYGPYYRPRGHPGLSSRVIQGTAEHGPEGPDAKRMPREGE